MLHDARTLLADIQGQVVGSVGMGIVSFGLTVCQCDSRRACRPDRNE